MYPIIKKRVLNETVTLMEMGSSSSSGSTRKANVCR